MDVAVDASLRDDLESSCRFAVDDKSISRRAGLFGPIDVPLAKVTCIRCPPSFQAASIIDTLF